MIPDECARPRPCNGADAVAAVGAEHEAKPAVNKLPVEGGGALRSALIVDEEDWRLSVRGPELEARTNLLALNGVSACYRNERGDTSSITSKRDHARSESPFSLR